VLEDSKAAVSEEKDNWENFEFYNAEIKPAAGRYVINYEDQRGLKTERTIEVKRVHENKGLYAIDAHCLLRNAHRSFLNERIQKAVNLESGQPVKNVAQDAMTKYYETDKGRVEVAMNKEWEATAVLTFVARADGQMRKAERAIIAAYIKKWCAYTTLEETVLDDSIRLVATPSNNEFKRLIRELKKKGNQEKLQDLLGSAERLVASQKTVNPLKKAAVEIIKEIVNK